MRLVSLKEEEETSGFSAREEVACASEKEGNH